jgi:hypothetical protein
MKSAASSTRLAEGACGSPPNKRTVAAVFPANRAALRRGMALALETVLEVPIRRHVFTSDRPFREVLDGIFGGISQPDIGALFSKLRASSSYEQYSSLVAQAQGSAGLMRFLAARPRRCADP